MRKTCHSQHQKKVGQSDENQISENQAEKLFDQDQENNIELEEPQDRHKNQQNYELQRRRSPTQDQPTKPVILDCFQTIRFKSPGLLKRRQSLKKRRMDEQSKRNRSSSFSQEDSQNYHQRTQGIFRNSRNSLKKMRKIIKSSEIKKQENNSPKTTKINAICQKYLKIIDQLKDILKARKCVPNYQEIDIYINAGVHQHQNQLLTLENEMIYYFSNCKEKHGQNKLRLKLETFDKKICQMVQFLDKTCGLSLQRQRLQNLMKNFPPDGLKEIQNQLLENKRKKQPKKKSRQKIQEPEKYYKEYWIQIEAQAKFRKSDEQKKLIRQWSQDMIDIQVINKIVNQQINYDKMIIEKMKQDLYVENDSSQEVKKFGPQTELEYFQNILDQQTGWNSKIEQARVYKNKRLSFILLYLMKQYGLNRRISVECITYHVQHQYYKHLLLQNGREKSVIIGTLKRRIYDCINLFKPLGYVYRNQCSNLVITDWFNEKIIANDTKKQLFGKVIRTVKQERKKNQALKKELELKKLTIKLLKALIIRNFMEQQRNPQFKDKEKYYLPIITLPYKDSYTFFQAQNCVSINGKGNFRDDYLEINLLALLKGIGLDLSQVNYHFSQIQAFLCEQSYNQFQGERMNEQDQKKQIISGIILPLKIKRPQLKMDNVNKKKKTSKQEKPKRKYSRRLIQTPDFVQCDVTPQLDSIRIALRQLRSDEYSVQIPAHLKKKNAISMEQQVINKNVIFQQEQQLQIKNQPFRIVEKEREKQVKRQKSEQKPNEQKGARKTKKTHQKKIMKKLTPQKSKRRRSQVKKEDKKQEI